MLKRGILQSFCLTAFFLLAVFSVNAQVNSPNMTCLSVNPAGDVTVTWIPSSDPTNVFVEYRIYSNNSGVFTLVGTETNLSVNSFTDVGANANTGSISYIVTSFSSSESTPQDTLSTIYLSVNNPGDGTAVLIWNAMSNPALSSASNWYMIYQEYPVGIWNLIDSTQYGNEYYRDTITICNAFINYRIDLADNSGCVSVSNEDGDNFQDMIPPAVPLLNWVTVDTANGDANLNWNSSTSSDAVGYIVLENISGGWVIIDTVFGYNSNTYTNLNAFVNFQSENYGIAAFDSCFNTSPMGIPQNTIYATTSLNICAKEITINWNNYQNWSTGIDRYELYASNGGAYSLIASLGNSINSYVHTGVSANTLYCYIIRAVNVGETASSISNKVCHFVKQPPLPQFAYLQTATVINDGEIEVRFHPDAGGIINSYTLERTTDLSTTFQFVDVSNGGSDPIIFNDYDVTTSSQNYYYRIALEDSCGRNSLVSNIGRTILLTINPNKTNLTNLLQWSKYEKWDGSILEYRIYRSLNGVFDNTPIASVSGSQHFYQDNIESLVTIADGEFCYYIEAVENVNNYGFSETSLSNQVCVNHTPLAYVPNAIYIGGINNTWKPIVNLFDYSSYEIIVVGRQGHVVFSSTNSDEAWDGSYKGKLVPIDVYVYQLSFMDSEGQYYEITGHVTVVR